LEAGSVPPNLNFSQLDFVEPSSGFHPVTWEHVNIDEEGVGLVLFFNKKLITMVLELWLHY
jgi:hypothetical protein